MGEVPLVEMSVPGGSVARGRDDGAGDARVGRSAVAVAAPARASLLRYGRAALFVLGVAFAVYLIQPSESGASSIFFGTRAHGFR